MSEAATPDTSATPDESAPSEARAREASAPDATPEGAKHAKGAETPALSPRSARAAWSWARAVDPLIFCGLFGAYLAALVGTAHTLGYARDEGFYFHAAGTYGRWFEQLLSNPSRALSPNVIDRFWQENREHPALMKSLFWLSQYSLDGRWFSERGTSLRFPAMVISSLGVATTFAFGRRCVGRAGGIVAALAFALMPQVFYHSHLACFDMPIASFWLFVAYAYYRSTQARGWPWAIAAAVLYGLALETKHNAWYLPPALVAHLLAAGFPAFVRRLRARRSSATAPRTAGPPTAGLPTAGPPPAGLPTEGRPGLFRGFGRWLLRGPLALALMVSIGPLVFYALWPWIWRDTWARLAWYFEFHWQHVYYNMEFLGRTYFEPPFPLTYAPLMTLATVPLITLVLAACGVVVALAAMVRGVRTESHVPLAASPSLRAQASLLPDSWSFGVLWAACLVLSYSPWLLPTTPIFGGTKHWLNAYPFLALFAGWGFAALLRVLRDALALGGPLRLAAPWVLGACTMVGPLAMTWHSHPWGLTAYTPLVGGAPGAATLGLNRSFWGYTTGSVTGYLNDVAARGARVFLHDTALDSFRMLQKDRRLRSDLKPWGAVAGSSVALYHHEQHMSRVEHMIWVDYGTTSPSQVATFDGVPMVWVYLRPSAPAKEPKPPPPKATSPEPPPPEPPSPEPPSP